MSRPKDKVDILRQMLEQSIERAIGEHRNIIRLVEIRVDLNVLGRYNLFSIIWTVHQQQVFHQEFDVPQDWIIRGGPGMENLQAICAHIMEMIVPSIMKSVREVRQTEKLDPERILEHERHGTLFHIPPRVQIPPKKSPSPKGVRVVRFRDKDND